MLIIKLFEIIVTATGVAMSLANYPQAFKIFKRKDADDVSVATYWIFFIGGLIWTGYGIYLKNLPIIASYTLGIGGSLAVLIGIKKYSKKAVQAEIQEVNNEDSNEHEQNNLL